jgi:putative nucleotidyltransferase with HDIG domain
VPYDVISSPSPLDARVEAALVARLDRGEFQLHVLPEAAAHILKETSREDWDAKSIVEKLKRDTAMAAHLLGLANSMAFRGAAPAVSLQQAVTRLGAANIRQLAVVIACETQVFRVPGFELEVRAVFRHCLATAFAAREIAKARRANVEDAFLLGLLHDVGWPLVLQTLVDVSKGLGQSVDKPAVLMSAQQHHARVAHRLGELWKLPDRVNGLFEHHHDTRWEGPHAPLAATLAFADVLSRHGEDPQ